jgi:hypothetical protein
MRTICGSVTARTVQGGRDGQNRLCAPASNFDAVRNIAGNTT